MNQLQVVSEVAKTCHEANRALCMAFGDFSQPTWADAPDWQRDSALNGVRFHIDNPDAGPDHSHNEWMREKLSAGWVHGAVKDAEAKTHPCIVEYDALPAEQKAKDFIFRAIVHAMVAPKVAA